MLAKVLSKLFGFENKSVTKYQEATKDEHAEDDEPPYDYYSPVEPISRLVSARVHIRYMDSHRNITERDYDITSFRRGDLGYQLNGFCHLRSARRVLVSQGVVACVDRETGEVVSHITSFLDEKYKATPASHFDAMLEDHGDAIAIFTYMAKADGALRAKEREIIIGFMQEEMSDGPPAEWLEKQLKESIPPTKYQFECAVRAQSGSENNYRARILEAVNVILATNKTQSEEETRALHYLNERLLEGKGRKIVRMPPARIAVPLGDAQEIVEEDRYSSIRVTLDKHKTAIQVLVATAEVSGGGVDQFRKSVIVEFLSGREKLDDQQKELLRKYIGDWRSGGINGLMVKCRWLVNEDNTEEYRKAVLTAADHILSDRGEVSGIRQNVLLEIREILLP